MAHETPPTIDPVAAARWLQAAPALSPWLHEEVARRMEERLEWITLKPSAWAHAARRRVDHTASSGAPAWRSCCTGDTGAHCDTGAHRDRHGDRD